MKDLLKLRIAGLAMALFVAFSFAVVVLGCREATPPLVTANSAKLAATSMKDIEVLLPLGLKTNEIVARIGNPVSSEDEAGHKVWKYEVTPFNWNAREDYQVVGIVLFITNGSLAELGGSYAPKERPRTVIKSDEVISPGSSNLLSLNFYIVHDSPVEAGRFVDTPQFPKLGFISAQPDFALARLAEVRLKEREVSQGGTNQNIWGLSFDLDRQDVERFGSFTMENRGKKVAIMVGAEMVTAPLIRYPILTGTFEIEFQEQSGMEQIRGKLNALLKPKE